ncbi:MAG TPA: adenylate/guanylate cyclase domain-containing protein [Candidatus Limnocylindrales bacterium]
MICPNCATENKPGRKFCVACATPLATACPNCGAAFDPGDVFCGECGTPLGGAQAAPARPAAVAPARPAAAAPAPAPTSQPALAERRLVTVLFADLVGFTPFAEERDAEDVRDTLTRYFELASEVIGRYGGTVEKFIGDAVMAVWGAPTAREDDAERAVRAGLDLVDAVKGLGPTIQARAGVLTGEAAVTVGATNQGMVAGDLVNTAARLQSVAQPGTVLVGEPTMRAASAAIAFEEAGDQALKGKQAPVAAYRALRVVSQRGGQGRSDLPEPPFVGREEELRLLKDLIATTGRDGRSRLVSITGPAGIGKSRLAWELEKYIDGISATIYWHRGRSPSYGEGVTFWALGEMVRRRLHLAEDDDEATTRERIDATIAEFVPDEEDRRWVKPALLTLLGLAPAPAGGRDVLFAAWRIFFERVAERGTTVLLFEDLQWADTGLLDFIEYLLEWSRTSPILVVALARPELFERRPDWGADVRNLTRLALEPLTDDAMRQLLDGFVPGLPRHAIELILARADGMPLYAVETVRALVADGRLVREGVIYRPAGALGELAIPETLRSLIASRLDALEPADRSLVADAAVLGQSFTPAGLGAISGHDVAELEPRLRALVRREIFEVEADPRSPERGQYGFVQSLIREVAYGTLAKRERRTRHLAAARYFEALGEDELAGALASHYLAAHEASAEGAEADAVAIQARIALSGAADRAVALGGHEQAVAFLRSAAAIADSPIDRAILLRRAAWSANARSDHHQAQTLAEEAQSISEQGADRAGAALAQALLGEILIDAGQILESRAVLDAATAALPESGMDEARAEVYSNLSRVLMRLSESAPSVAAADVALAIAERLKLDRIVAETLNNKGSALIRIGRRREGVALNRAAVEIARAGGHVAAEIRALANTAVNMDDLLASREVNRQAFDLAMRVGNVNLARWSRESARFAGFLLAEDWDGLLAESWADVDASMGGGASLSDEARWLSTTIEVRLHRGLPAAALIERLGEIAGEVSDPSVSADVMAIQASTALVAGDYAQAALLELEAASLGSQISFIYLSFAARAFLLARDVEGARSAADRHLQTSVGNHIDEAQDAGLRAGIAALEGRIDDAVAGYRDANAQLEAIHFDWLTALLGFEFVSLVGIDHPATREAADRSRAIFERVGARPWLEKLDALEASSRRPALARVREASADPGPVEAPRI